MTYHVWGDEWFEKHGKELDQAIGYIADFVWNYGFCYMSIKEKYGTIRYGSLFPKLPNVWSCGNVFQKFIYYKVALKYAQFIRRLAVTRALRKFPNVRAEILADFRDDEVMWF